MELRLIGLSPESLYCQSLQSYEYAPMPTANSLMIIQCFRFRFGLDRDYCTFHSTKMNGGWCHLNGFCSRQSATPLILTTSSHFAIVYWFQGS